jgi:hypothetical protein
MGLAGYAEKRPDLATSTNCNTKANMATIKEALMSVMIGNRSHYDNLAVFPLLRDQVIKSEYYTLDMAMTLGKVYLEEIPSRLKTPEVKILNLSYLPVLIVQGEKLRSTTCDTHIATDSILIPPRTALTVPLPKVKPSQHDKDYAGLQKPRFFPQLQRCINTFECDPLQVGAIFAINGQIEGLELFDSPDTMAVMHKKLMRHYAKEAVKRSHRQTLLTYRHDAQRFLTKLRQAHEQCHLTIGLGKKLKVTGREISGRGIRFNENLLHLRAHNNPGLSALYAY